MQAAVRRPLMKSQLWYSAHFLFLQPHTFSVFVRLTADSPLSLAAFMAERPNGWRLSCVTTFYCGLAPRFVNSLQYFVSYVVDSFRETRDIFKPQSSRQLEPLVSQHTVNKPLKMCQNVY
jgi:hypothetical protein